MFPLYSSYKDYLVSHNTVFTEGELILVECGSFSEYSIDTLWRVLKPFDAKDFLLSYEMKNDEGVVVRSRQALDTRKLLEEGFVQEEPTRFIHNGDDW